MISFIVPVFGESRKPYLEVLIESYLDAYKNEEVEFILVEMVSLSGRPYYKYIFNPSIYKFVSFTSNYSYERSKSLNVGAFVSRGDVLVFHDVDVPLPSDFFLHITEMCEKGYKVFSNFEKFFRLSKESTDLVMQGKCVPYDAPLEGSKEEGHGDGWTKLSCSIDRKVFYRSGCWNPNFVGWGLEDDEYSRRLEYLEYTQQNAPLNLVHLWHPLTSPNWTKSEKSIKLYERTKSDPAKVIRELREYYEV